MPDPKFYGLNDLEYQKILGSLGREPNHVEMGIFSAMWSEHCSYKHTRPLFSQFPTKAPWVAVGPGENAGAVAIDDTWVVVFKVESHNHPSYIAPYDGAATGVGGLVRDIIAMGARPIGVKTVLRTGPLDDESTRCMVEEIQRGASEYSKTCGIVSLGTDWKTHPSYATNPLVNVLVLGLARRDRLTRSSAGIPGNILVYYGLPTGSDGVNGASFASKGMDKTTEAHPPAGDPQAGRELMFATLELIEKGLIAGIQDMGAAGLTCSSFEMVQKAGFGLELNLDSVPSSAGIQPYALMLSETQERMLVSVEPRHLDAVMCVLQPYSHLKSAVIGNVIDGNEAILKQNGEIIARLPVDLVVDGFPRIQINEKQAAGTPHYDAAIVKEDTVTTVTVHMPAAEASQLEILTETTISNSCSIIDIPEIKKSVLLHTASNSPALQTQPYDSVVQLVEDACHEITATGARPLGLTDGLNFGNPDEPFIGYQITQSLRGLADSCRHLQVPIVGGNVSLYNETNNHAILGQLIIGVVGVKTNGS